MSPLKHGGRATRLPPDLGAEVNDQNRYYAEIGAAWVPGRHTAEEKTLSPRRTP